MQRLQEGPTPQEWDTFAAMGDFNRDGYINNLDENIIVAAYDAIPGDPNWDPRCDLNGDSIINSFDLVIFSGNYGLNIWDYFGYEKPIQVWPLLLVGGLVACFALPFLVK